jgi:hypothetical protein
MAVESVPLKNIIKLRSKQTTKDCSDCFYRHTSFNFISKENKLLSNKTTVCSLPEPVVKMTAGCCV